MKESKFKYERVGKRYNHKIKDDDSTSLPISNFFKLEDNFFPAFNQFDLTKNLERINNLTEEEIRANYFQQKNFQMKNKEEKIIFSLDEVKFATSSKCDNDDNVGREYYLLNNLNDYLLPDDINSEDKSESKNKKKYELEFITQSNGKQNIFIRCLVQEDKFSSNIINSS